MARRENSFLLSWVIGLALTMVGILAYGLFTSTPSRGLGALAMSSIITGFFILYAAARQFRTGIIPFKTLIVVSCVAVIALSAAFLSGYGGIGFMLFNTATAIVMLAIAHQYWLGRAESPGVLSGMAVLYGATSLSFLACALALVQRGQWQLEVAPSGWVEDINMAVCIAGMSGIGALSLTLHQTRITARHRLEAMTDALTGLCNRRALFNAHGTKTFHEDMAMLVFDIDRFKTINDRYGHAVGDEVIRNMAAELKAAIGLSSVTRLGGEEFAAVLENAAPGRAEWIGERIRRQLQDREVVVEGDSFVATTSVGIAYGTVSGLTFDEILNLADNALYNAKRLGRNRVETAVANWESGLSVEADSA
ncbi:GGDEF domain-containing protein [Agrobacterium vitis]|uniref:GGDEF domain-containing protein n=1 Tax=Agrobacterium vitis TaxID=373 RepID=UPI0018D1FDF1|nr:GGDEF domain-containing protein [Agrobacterium vitis]